MDRMVAYCGLDCEECPAYLATIGDDDDQREKVAAEWSTAAYPLEAADINCQGCTGQGKVLSFVKDCEMRQCSIARQVENCAHCDEYPCGKLERAAPEARATLAGIRRGLASP